MKLNNMKLNNMKLNNMKLNNMKLNNMKLLLIGIFSSLLVACGGGSGNNPNTGLPNNSVGVQGLLDLEALESFNPTVTTNLTNINRVTFKGRSILLVPSQAISNSYIDNPNEINQEDKEQNLLVSYNKDFSYLSRFGIVLENNGQDDDHFAFSQGIATPLNNIPLSGKATYNGIYTSILNPSGMIYHDSSDYGTVLATVDFLNKIADITLSKGTAGYYEERTIKNQIEGNKFSSSDDRMRGFFYGNQAQELGGVYNESSDKNSTIKTGVTAFGAIKTK